MSNDWPQTKKRAVSARAMFAPMTQYNMNKRNTRTTTRNTKAAKAAPAAPAPAAPAAITPAAIAAAIAADPNLLASIASMLGLAPAPAPAVAPAPAPAVAPAAKPTVPDEIKALVGRNVVIRYEAAKYPGRPLVYTVSVDTAWCAKGTVFIKGPVAERDGAERWFEVPRIREWISRG